MKNSSLIQLLESFSVKEVKEFGDFIRSPFFNKNESAVSLYNYLRKYYPDFEEGKISKEEVHKKIFPGVKYNDGFMRKTIFILAHLAESYISYNKFTKNKIESGLDFLEELNERKLGKLFTKHFTGIKNEIEKDTDKNHNYYLRKYKIESLLSTFVDRNRYKVDLHDKKEFHNEQVEEKLFYFTNYFLLISLNMYRFLKYQNYSDKVEFNDDLLDNIINYLMEQESKPGVAKPGYMDNLTTRLYLYEVMLMKNKSGNEDLPDDIYYQRLKKMLNNEPGLSHDSKFSLYNILMQHCAYKILRGFNGYEKERWELDKTALSYGIYKSASETFFPPPAFATFVKDAVIVNEIEWAVSFVEEYKKILEPENYETVYNLSFSMIYFYKGEYEKTLDYLNKIKPVKRWEFKFAVKEVTLQVFYELSLYTQAYYLIDSFRHFISSMTKNFSPDRIESRNNFLKYYTNLLKLKENSETKGVSRIIEELKDKDLLIFNRDWLTQKANEIKKRK